MSFSGKDDQNLGTANWQSDHYLSFTRISLFHFGSLEKDISIPPGMEEVVKSFKRMRVLWFCLMSSLLSEQKLKKGRIGNLVRLFLSACREFWDSSPNQAAGEGKEGEKEEQEPKKKKRKRLPAKSQRRKIHFYHRSQFLECSQSE
jgi:hypothetical protein